MEQAMKLTRAFQGAVLICRIHDPGALPAVARQLARAGDDPERAIESFNAEVARIGLNVAAVLQRSFNGRTYAIGGDA